MLLLLDAQGTVALHEASDFKRLSLATMGEPSGSDIDAALKKWEVGTLLSSLPGHVGVSIDWLRAHFSQPDDRKSFEAMVAYADSKGWLTQDRSMLIVHYSAAAE
jgi:hypothetical protein